MIGTQESSTTVKCRECKWTFSSFLVLEIGAPMQLPKPTVLTMFDMDTGILLVPAESPDNCDEINKRHLWTS